MERGNLVAYKGSEEHKALEETTVWINKGNGSLIIEHADGYEAAFYDVDGSLKLDHEKKYLLVLDRQVEPLTETVELPEIEVGKEEEVKIIQVEQPITIKHRKASFANPGLSESGKIELPISEQPKEEVKQEEKEVTVMPEPEATSEVAEIITNTKKEVAEREAAMKELAEEAIASNIFVLNEETDVYHVLGRTEYDMTTRNNLAQFLGNTPEYVEFTKDLLASQKSLKDKLESVDGISKKVAEQLALTHITAGKLKDALHANQVDCTKKVKKLLEAIL